MTRFNEAVLKAIAWAESRKSDEEGQGLTEYALIMALVAVVAVVALGTLGDNITAKLQEVAGELG